MRTGRPTDKVTGMIQGALRLGTRRSPAAVAESRAEEDESDADLAVRARVEREAFARLYARYVDPIYRYCAHRLADREAAEDATSQVFTLALAAMPRYREQGSFRSWLFAIAHNVVADAARRSRRASASGTDDLIDEVVDPAPTPEDVVLAAQASDSVRRLLAALPADQRRVMELRLSGLSSPEVARIVGRSPTAIRSLQFRAVERLRLLLATDGTMSAPRATGDDDGHR